ncbi:Uncharacterised protein [Enterobacter hormaechei]|nr:Uncharacterised protein [Enterobacter hormaechei]SAB51926.1 Uncharacterised protein [Enterobacter hormaechei]
MTEKPQVDFEEVVKSSGMTILMPLLPRRDSQS